ncbi:MAG: polysaccharide deacetylase family protein [Candidatus Krumholzibacteriota bacterium]|nr:polysaccharide deacetylase family protein [Candidatus Krumholzibacteriota bacterium]
MSDKRPDTVPLLVTMDLEFAPDHDAEAQSRVLGRLAGDLAPMGIPLTVFATADAAERFAGPVRRLAGDGHDIACHGLDHGRWEDYRALPFERARSSIGEAAGRIGAIAGERPTSFRGPGMTTSSAAQRALEEHGFLADFSVCPQRIDLVGRAGDDPARLVAPRRPYRPSADSPYRRGTRPILVVPLSGFGAPFLSGVLFMVGPGAMKLFFRALLAEARRTGSPIVYLFHSYEFAAYTGVDGGAARDGHARGDGPVARRRLHRLYMRSRRRRYEATLSLFDYMRSFGDVRPMTARQFLGSRPAGGRDRT